MRAEVMKARYSIRTMDSERVTARYSIDDREFDITGTKSECYIQLDVILSIYGERFKFIGVKGGQCSSR